MPRLQNRGMSILTGIIRVVGVGSLMDHRMLPLMTLVRSVARFASFGIVRVSLFGEVFLRGYCEDELLPAFTAYEDPRFKAALHVIPSLLKSAFSTSSVRYEFGLAAEVQPIRVTGAV